MCKCPVEVRYDDSRFVREEEEVQYASSPNLDNEQTTFSDSKDEIHQHHITVIYHIHECGCCGDEFSEFAGFAKI